jgi:hypothetical protein
MTLAALATHLLYALQTGRTETVVSRRTVVEYHSAVTWVVLALALAWVVLLLLRAYTRARRVRRPPRRKDYGPLKRVVKLKREFSRTLLRPGFSANIHAVGVGLLGGYAGEYCIQVFVSDSNAEMWDGAGAEPVPDLYRGVPVILVEMLAAGFISQATPPESVTRDGSRGGIREPQEVIVGGLSGANTNLAGQSGTIGYFCTRRSLLPRRKEIHLLSNSHVFADLRKASVDAGDLIMHPSPGEPATGRPVGALVNFTAVKFDGGTGDPNYVDAALAKLWGPQQHSPLIPFVGAVKGYVNKGEVELGEPARKFGRTTGYTEGRVFSVHMDIWIRYDRTGQSAFFQDQILVEPDAPDFPAFVSKGDSGSLVVDEHQHALGLIFAGTSDAPPAHAPSPNPRPDPAAPPPKRVEGYGVANPIAEVLDRLKIELVI